MEEIWTPVVGWGPYYQVSTLGRIKSTCKPVHIIRKQRSDKDGYMLVGLSHTTIGEKTAKVHREVLAAFIGPCPDGHQVNHKNGIRDDNRLENLEYLTLSENTQHAWRTVRSPEVSSFSKITEETAKKVRADYLETRKLASIAKKYGLSRNAVWLIGTAKTWKHI